MVSRGGWVSYNPSPRPLPPLRTDLARPHPHTKNFTASVSRTNLAHREVAVASSLVSRRGAKYTRGVHKNTRKQKKLKKVLRFFD